MGKTSDDLGYCTIDANDLLAALSCAQKKANRPMLEGVHVVCTANTLTIDGTDTYKLVRIERHLSQRCKTFDAVLDGASLKSAIKRNGTLSIHSIDGEKGLEGSFLPRCGNAYKVYISFAAGAYPNVEGALKLQESSTIALPLLNPDYTASVLKAAALAFPKGGVKVEPQGKYEPTLFRADDGKDRFIGLVMPLRDEHPKEAKVSGRDSDSADVTALKRRIAKLEQENKELHEASEQLYAEKHKAIHDAYRLQQQLSDAKRAQAESKAQPMSPWDSALTRPAALYEAMQMVPA